MNEYLIKFRTESEEDKGIIIEAKNIKEAYNKLIKHKTYRIKEVLAIVKYHKMKLL